MITTHTSDSYSFSVSEILPDRRVLVVTYVHIGDQITCVMDCYKDMSLQGGKRYLDVHLRNNAATPKLERGSK